MVRNIFSVEGKRDLVLAQLLGPAFGKHRIEEKTFPDLKDITAPRVDVGLKVKVDSLGQVEGTRMSVPLKFVQFPILMQLLGVARLEKRQHDLVLMNPLSLSTKAVVRIPEGWTVAKLPDPKEIVVPFARFTVSARAEGNTVLFERDVSFTRNRVGTEEYAAFRDFLDKANASMTEKLVLEKAPGAPAGGGR
jgi:hypothetical protein